MQKMQHQKEETPADGPPQEAPSSQQLREVPEAEPSTREAAANLASSEGPEQGLQAEPDTEVTGGAETIKDGCGSAYR